MPAAWLSGATVRPSVTSSLRRTPNRGRGCCQRDASSPVKRPASSRPRSARRERRPRLGARVARHDRVRRPEGPRAREHLMEFISDSDPSEDREKKWLELADAPRRFALPRHAGADSQGRRAGQKVIDNWGIEPHANPKGVCEPRSDGGHRLRRRPIHAIDLRLRRPGRTREQRGSAGHVCCSSARSAGGAASEAGGLRALERPAAGDERLDQDAPRGEQMTMPFAISNAKAHYTMGAKARWTSRSPTARSTR